jgi:soluble lytic murein transglycosylase-like protein
VKKVIGLVLIVVALAAVSPSRSTPRQSKPPTLTLDQIINREAIINNLRPSLIRAIIAVESSGNPKAVSKKGCKGLMQVNPEHLEYFGYKASDLLEEEPNVIAGSRLAREELDRFGNEFDMLRAYNCGSPKARQYKRCGADYARKVLATEKKIKASGKI